MGNPGWKCFERRVAGLFNVKREGMMGGSDFETTHLAGETKVLKKLPKWLTTIYGQANNNCPKGKHPVAIIKQKHMKDDSSFVIMRLKNFLSCFFEEKKK